MKMGKECDVVMKKAIKAIYILIVALIVFTGALLIAQGVEENRTGGAAAAAKAAKAPEAQEATEAPEDTTPPVLFDDEEGSAI